MRQEFWVAAGAEHQSVRGSQRFRRHGCGVKGAARTADTVAAKVRHQARVRVVAIEQCASGSTLLCVSIGGRKAMVAMAMAMVMVIVMAMVMVMVMVMLMAMVMVMVMVRPDVGGETVASCNNKW